MSNWIEVAEKMMNIEISPKQKEKFNSYEDELVKWNERINLTSIRDREGIEIKHFLDSLTCIKVLQDMNGKSLIDVGTGAGFPGIPLKIIFPEMRLTLTDSVGKKADFCERVITILHLENCQVLKLRAEEMGVSELYREKFDCAAARAVAALPTLTEYLLPLVKTGGIMLAQKGGNTSEELLSAEHAIKRLGGKARDLIPIEIPGLPDPRFLVAVDKISHTPSAYPRRPGLPTKKPIL